MHSKQKAHLQLNDIFRLTYRWLVIYERPLVNISITIYLFNSSRTWLKIFHLYISLTVQQEAVMKVACYMTISQQVVVWFTNAGTLTGHILGWLAKLDAS